MFGYQFDAKISKEFVNEIVEDILHRRSTSARICETYNKPAVLYSEGLRGITIS